VISLQWRLLLLVDSIAMLCYNLAVFGIGSGMETHCKIWSISLLNVCSLLAIYVSWRRERDFRSRWKDLKRLETHNQAMHDLMSTVFEVELTAGDDLVLCTQKPAVEDLFGNVAGQKLQDLVMPECVELLNRILTPVLDDSSDLRVVMTPPVTLRSSSSVATSSGCHLVQAVIVVADTCGLYISNDASWRYLVGLRDFQYIANVELSPSESVEEESEVSSTTVGPSQSDGSCSTTVTARVFQGVELATTRIGSAPISACTQWRALMDLGKREHWLIPEGNIIRAGSESVLGRGGFGSVHKGCLYGCPIALKTPVVRNETHLHQTTFALANELRVLRLLRHPNIVILHGACINLTEGGVTLVLELIDGVSLQHCLDTGNIDKYVLGRWVVLENIACAMRYLHAQTPTIVHSDLKDTNIMVEKWKDKPRARLLDFGLSQIVAKNSNLAGGSWRWAAPEFYEGRSQARPSSDVFSLGRLLHRVLTGERPLSGISEKWTMQLFATQGLLWMPTWYGDSVMCNTARWISSKSVLVDQSMRCSMKDIHTEMQTVLARAFLEQLSSVNLSSAECDEPSFSISVNVLDTGMPILQCSGAFRRLTDDTCIGVKLLDVAQNPRLLHMWIQLHVQLLADFKAQEDSLQTEFSFAWPNSRGTVTKMCAICQPLQWEEPEMVISIRNVRMITEDLSSSN